MVWRLTWKLNWRRGYMSPTCQVPQGNSQLLPRVQSMARAPLLLTDMRPHSVQDLQEELRWHPHTVGEGLLIIVQHLIQQLVILDTAMRLSSFNQLCTQKRFQTCLLTLLLLLSTSAAAHARRGRSMHIHEGSLASTSSVGI